MSRLWNRNVGRRNSSQTARKHTSPRRRLRSEKLETRQLLAANAFHNELMPEDVNEDGQITAADALAIINQMGRQEAGETLETTGKAIARVCLASCSPPTN